MTDFGEVLVSGLAYGVYGAHPLPDQPPINSTRNPNNGTTGSSFPPIELFISPPVKGNGLVNRSNGQHTFQIQTSNFTGNVQIEATLSRDPNCGPWVPIALVDPNGNPNLLLQFKFAPSVQNSPNTGLTIQTNTIYIATGQFAWLRCIVTNVTAGILQSVKVAY